MHPKLKAANRKVTALFKSLPLTVRVLLVAYLAWGGWQLCSWLVDNDLSEVIYVYAAVHIVVAAAQIVASIRTIRHNRTLLVLRAETARIDANTAELAFRNEIRSIELSALTNAFADAVSQRATFLSSRLSRDGDDIGVIPGRMRTECFDEAGRKIGDFTGPATSGDTALFQLPLAAIPCYELEQVRNWANHGDVVTVVLDITSKPDVAGLNRTHLCITDGFNAVEIERVN